MDTITVLPIGVVRGGRAEVKDDDWGSIVSVIELDATQFDQQVVTGLDAFSHLEVVYSFHLVTDEKVEMSARHPRNRTDWPKVGIFAQRGKKPRNRLAVSGCWIVKVKPQRDLRRS